MQINDIEKYITQIINDCNHHPFLFAGSGFTKRYFNLYSWEELLRKFAFDFSQDEFRFDKYKNNINSTVPNILYPKIASILEKDYNNAVLSLDKYKEFREKYKEQIKSGISPFKIALAEYFSNINIETCSNEEFIFFKNNMQAHVAGIITTNYDLVLDNIFNKFTVYTNQEELIFADIYNIGEIYKIHGSATNPDSIIINEEDYNIFNKKYAYLTAKLLTIFIENPIIFIGYSMNDSNIHAIMKSISECLNQEHLKKLENRLIFIEYSETEEKIETVFKYFDSNSAIPMTKITTNNFLGIYKGIINTTITIKPYILRQIRKEIYELAKISNPVSKIYATDLNNIDDIPDDSNLMLSVGVYKTGYGKSVKGDMLYEDIVFNNKSFPAEFIVKEVLPELLIHHRGGLPIFKYLKECKKYIVDDIKEEYEKRKCLDDFLNASIKKAKINYRRKLKHKTIEEIIKIEGMENAFKKIYFLNEDEIDLGSLHSYLKNNYNSSNKNNPEMRRLIRIYDFLQNRF
ncbi:MAG: SIR2 family protein [Candidatus Mucispirillum faecigallinarum]|nr:SIR2 family protein [Candidatus Mucispirillum faecigallinarum]